MNGIKIYGSLDVVKFRACLHLTVLQNKMNGSLDEVKLRAPYGAKNDCPMDDGTVILVNLVILVIIVSVVFDIL